MKKLFLIVFVTLIVTIRGTAQTVVTGGFRRAGTNAQTKAMQRQKLQDSLGLTTSQAMSVDAIQQNYMLKMRAVKLDTKMTAADKKSKLQELQMERKTKLKAVISDQQIAKMDGQPQKSKKKIYYRKKSVTRH